MAITVTQSNFIAAAGAFERAAMAIQHCAHEIARLEARVASLEATSKDAIYRPNPSPGLTVAVVEIDSESRSHVDTTTAARWLSRSPQTLRKWACYQDGPLRPQKVSGRLSWSVSEIRAILSRK